MYGNYEREGWTGLAIAIIVQAVEDFEKDRTEENARDLAESLQFYWNYTPEEVMTFFKKLKENREK